MPSGEHARKIGYKKHAEIQALRTSGMTLRAIGSRYGVSAEAVRLILKKMGYVHVPKEDPLVGLAAKLGFDLVSKSARGIWTYRCRSCGHEAQSKRSSIEDGTFRCSKCSYAGLRASQVGQKHGLWTVVGYPETGKWRVRCACGVERLRNAAAIRTGRSKGCCKCRHRARQDERNEES
jgi:hypothetical protein